MEKSRRRILCQARFVALYLVCAGWSIASSFAQLGTPPIIAVQPLNTSVPNGDKLVLATTASSLTTMTFNWRLNGQTLSNASVANVVIPTVGTVSTLTLSNITPVYAGQYSVQVVNAVGSATSRNATVSVLGGVVADQVSSAKTNASTLRWSHTIGYGENRLLLVTTAHCDGKKTVASVTYRGIPLTEIGVTNGDSDANSCSIWKLVAPPIGTGEMVVTLNSSLRAAAGATSFFGVDQADPIGTVATSSGKDLPVGLMLSAAAGQVIVDVLAANGEAVSADPGANQFQKWNLQTGTSGGEIIGGSSVKSGAQNVSTSWTLAQGKPWALAAVALKPASTLPISMASSGSGLGLTANGFVFKISGPTGSTFVIETSGDLKTWTPISTNVALGGLAAWTDATAVNFPFRYYRAKLQ